MKLLKINLTELPCITAGDLLWGFWQNCKMNIYAERN